MCWATQPEWAVIAGLSLMGGLAVLVFRRWIADRWFTELQGGMFGPIGTFSARLQGRTGTGLGIVLLGGLMVGVGALAVHACASSP